jgi:hypothetical protein
MPTKTKPKRPVDAYMVPVRITEKDKLKLQDIAGFDRKTDPDGTRASSLSNALESFLTIHSNKLRRLHDKPLPTHVVAALKPIAKDADKLAALLHPNNLSMEVARELGGYDVAGKAWHLLTEIRIAASFAIGKLEQQDCTGIHRKQHSDTMELAKADLGQLFSSHAIYPSDGDEAEFIKICLRYLPKPASAKK